MFIECTLSLWAFSGADIIIFLKLYYVVSDTPSVLPAEQLKGNGRAGQTDTHMTGTECPQQGVLFMNVTDS